MFNILEVNSTFNDTWRMTFYFIVAIAILLGLLWTVFQLYKNDKKKNTSNEIYDKSYDAIEEDNIKRKNKNTNYYDVYQTSRKKNLEKQILDGDELDTKKQL